MDARSRDDVTALAAHVEALTDHVRAVAHLHALGEREVDVSPAAACERLHGVRDRAETPLRIHEGIVAAVSRVDVEHHEPRAGRDADVRVGPPLPPRADRVAVRRRVEAPAVTARVLARGAVGRTTRAPRGVHGVQREHAPPEVQRVPERSAPERRGRRVELNLNRHVVTPCAASAAASATSSCSPSGDFALLHTIDVREVKSTDASASSASNVPITDRCRRYTTRGRGCASGSDAARQTPSTAAAWACGAPLSNTTRRPTRAPRRNTSATLEPTTPSPIS